MTRRRARSVFAPLTMRSGVRAVREDLDKLVEVLVAYREANDPDVYAVAEGLTRLLQVDLLTLHCGCGRRLSSPQCGICDNDA